jgi:hypothetical protein
MIGTFKTNVNKQILTQSLCITSNDKEVFHHYLQDNGSFIENFNIKDKSFYHLLKYQPIVKMETEAPIYDQIVQIEQMELYKLSKIIESKGGKVISLSTDKVICSFQNNILPFDLDESNNIKGYHFEISNNLKYKLENRNDNLTISKMEKKIRMDIYNYFPKQWYNYKDIDDNNFKMHVDTIINNKKSFNIDGPAGTGKSYLIKELQKRMSELELGFISLAPTNKAARIINGITLHKFASKLKKSSCLNNMNVDYIFIDEISMVKEIFYKFLLMIKTMKPNIKFIITGDFNQLKPVNDRVCVDYKNSLALFELCDGNRLILSKCRRSDDTLFNMCKFENIESIQRTDFNNEFTFKHISYTHKTRIEVNDKMMKNAYEKKYRKNGLRLAKNNYDPHSQNVILMKETPIICHKNCEEKNLINNETFVIVKIKSNYIIIKNDEKTISINTDEFQELFYPAYCITIHSSQGETFNEPYSIHDWNLLTKRLKYVALTRATQKEYINII